MKTLLKDKNYVIGSICFIAYMVMVIFTTCILSELLWYSDTTNHSNVMTIVICVLIEILSFVPGAMMYFSKINKGYFIKEGLV